MKSIPAPQTTKDTQQLRAAITSWLREVTRNYRDAMGIKNNLQDILKSGLPPLIAKQQIEQLMRFRGNYQIENWLLLQSQTNQRIKEISRFYTRSKATVADIQEFATIFLEEYFYVLCAFYPGLKQFSPDRSLIHHMANVATALHIENWMTASTTCKGTINSLSEHGFRLKSESSIEYSYPEGKDKDTLMRAFWKHEAHIAIYREQLKNETGETRRATYKTTKGRKMNFLELEWCRAYAEGHIHIVERLFSDHFPNRVSEHNTHQNIALQKDCLALFSYAKGISELYTENYYVSNLQKIRLFVLGNMLLHKIERAYHFHLVNLLSHCQVKMEDADTPYREGLKSVYLGRFSEDTGILFDTKKVIDKKGEIKGVFPNEPYDILSYPDQIKNFYEIQSLEEYSHEVSRETIKRRAMNDIVLILHKIFPVAQLPPWSSMTFRDAAKFYYRDYNVAVSFLDAPPVAFSEEKSSTNIHRYYNFYHKTYCELYRKEDSLMPEGNEALKQAKAKQKEQRTST